LHSPTTKGWQSSRYILYNTQDEGKNVGILLALWTSSSETLLHLV